MVSQRLLFFYYALKFVVKTTYLFSKTKPACSTHSAKTRKSDKTDIVRAIFDNFSWISTKIQNYKLKTSHSVSEKPVGMTVELHLGSLYSMSHTFDMMSKTNLTTFRCQIEYNNNKNSNYNLLRMAPVIQWSGRLIQWSASIILKNVVHLLCGYRYIGIF